MDKVTDTPKLGPDSGLGPEFTDEALMAWADRELPLAEFTRLQSAMGANPALAARARAFTATREMLPKAYADILCAPVPPSLLALLESTVPKAEVAPQSRQTARSPRTGLPPWAGIPQWLVWTSGLALAGLAAVAVLPPQIGRPPGTGAGTGHMAAGDLAGALDAEPMLPHQAALPAGRNVRVLTSFATKSGTFCRQYVRGDSTPGMLAGVACRKPEGWEILAEAPTSGPAGAQSGTRTAAGANEPATITKLIDDLIAGDVLGPAEEKAAIANGWKR